MIADDFFPVPRMQLNADGVAHSTGGKKQRGLLASSSATRSSSVDRGVFAVNVIADFGLGHGATHGGGRLVTVSLRRSIMRRSIIRIRRIPRWKAERHGRSAGAPFHRLPAVHRGSGVRSRAGKQTSRLG